MIVPICVYLRNLRMNTSILAIRDSNYFFKCYCVEPRARVRPVMVAKFVVHLIRKTDPAMA